jgi:3-phenylpropionate/cinnamic acid dioxygenase small subunit
MSQAGVSFEERAEIEAFLFLEARLADESSYAEWEALLTDDIHYWVPFGKADYDPTTRISFINDNRTRVATRVRQLLTGDRHAQTPASPMRRLLSNIEVLERDDDGYAVAANFVLYEHSVQATHELRVWAGRITYGLRRTGDGLRMKRKVVELVNSTDALPTLAFII